MNHSNVLQFPADRFVALPSDRKRRRGDRNSIRRLAEPLLGRVEAVPPDFQKLFLLRLEIMVHELELDVEAYWQ